MLRLQIFLQVRIKKKEKYGKIHIVGSLKKPNIE